MRYAVTGLTIIILLLTVSCTNQKTEHTTVTISITPWVGFYPLYFAIEKGFDEDNGVELRIVETMTAADFTRANIKEHIDAVASSPMELLKLNKILKEPLVIALFVDYSKGADVIVARKDIKTLEELKGRRVGYETNSLEHLFLNLALSSVSLTQDDIQPVNAGQISASEMFEDNKIDAYSTFPPTSTTLLEQGDLHVVFDSGKIPFSIIDIVSLKYSRQYKLAPLQNIWYQVTEYIKKNPQEYIQFLAGIMKVSENSAQIEFNGIQTLGEREQSEITKAKFTSIMEEACRILSEEVLNCGASLSKVYLNGETLK